MGLHHQNQQTHPQFFIALRAAPPARPSGPGLRPTPPACASGAALRAQPPADASGVRLRRGPPPCRFARKYKPKAAQSTLDGFRTHLHKLHQTASERSRLFGSASQKQATSDAGVEFGVQRGLLARGDGARAGAPGRLLHRPRPRRERGAYCWPPGIPRFHHADGFFLQVARHFLFFSVFLFLYNVRVTMFNPCE